MIESALTSNHTKCFIHSVYPISMVFKRGIVLAEICGIHAGDGYLRNDGKRVELDISGNLEEQGYYDLHVTKLFKEEFFKFPNPKYFPSRKTYGFVIRSKNIVEFMNLIGFPYGAKSSTVRIPKFVFKKKIFMIYFLRGYFDTDGHLGFFRRSNSSYSKYKRTHNYYPRIMLSSISKELIQDVGALLTILNFNFRIHKSNPIKKGEHRKFHITINGVNNLLKWVSLIGMRNPVKFSRLLVWLNHGFCQPNMSLSDRVKLLK